MNHHQNPGFAAKSWDDEALFFLRVVWIRNHKRFFVVENRFCFLECDAVFCGVARRLSRIPLEGEFICFD
jgi:hypothetical protein